MDRAAFYDVMRDKFGTLSQSQVDGTEALLNEGEEREVPLEQLAYVLSTSWHETASTMEPIAEYGKGEGHDYGEPLPQYDNQCAYGRGYVQLTWAENYERADSECGLDGKLLEDFELALDPEVAAQIIFEGMSEGWFTGKKLDDYINEDEVDYVNARRIVNGTDRADMLAGYAESFQLALESADYGEEEPEEPEVPESGVSPEEGEHPPEQEEPMQYEYAVDMIVSTESLTERLNARGAEGWRLAHITAKQFVWERPRG